MPLLVGAAHTGAVAEVRAVHVQRDGAGVTYVSDVTAAMNMAKDVAGDKDVLVHGARTAQLALAAGVLDELQIHLVPVFIGQGEPLFEDSPDTPMGIGGFRLFNWLDRRNAPRPNGQVYTEVLATRAVIAGRRTYEHADRWQGDHHDGVPVFVLTHNVPDDPPPGSVRYVTDVRECAAQARAAARDGDVMVHGAGAAQALLRAGQLDELELHVVPVLLGQGRRPHGATTKSPKSPVKWCPTDWELQLP